MRKMEAVRVLEKAGAGFLAKVVLVRHRHPAKKLIALAKLVEAGHHVGLMPFEIDGLMIDGRAARWDALGVADWRDHINALKAEAAAREAA